MSVYYSMTQSLGAEVPWYNFILKIPIAIFSILGGIIMLSMGAGGLFFIMNFVNAKEKLILLKTI